MGHNIINIIHICILTSTINAYLKISSRTNFKDRLGKNHLNFIRDRLMLMNFFGLTGKLTMFSLKDLLRIMALFSAKSRGI